MSDDNAAYDPTHPLHIGPMGEMAEQALEEAERQWLSEHPGCTVEDYEDHIERKYQEDLDEEKKTRSKAIVARWETMLAALRSGTYWVNKDAQKISIRQIDRRYAKYLCRWLEERRKGLHEMNCLISAVFTMPSGEQAQYAVEVELDRLNEMEPAEWLKEQPLYKHLRLIAQGKELIMNEKQQFTLRLSTPVTGEVKETWVEASNKNEAAQKFLRRKYVAEWFVEGDHPMQLDVFSKVEIEEQKRAEESKGHDISEGDQEQTAPSGDATEFLQQVEERAKELYALSNQGRWEDLDPSLQEHWINAAGRELRGED